METDKKIVQLGLFFERRYRDVVLHINSAPSGILEKNDLNVLEGIFPIHPAFMSGV